MVDTAVCVPPSRQRRIRRVVAGVAIVLLIALVGGWSSWNDASCACDAPSSLFAWVWGWNPVLAADERIAFQEPWGQALRVVAAAAFVLFWLVPPVTALAAVLGAVRVRAAAWASGLALVALTLFLATAARNALGVTFRDMLIGTAIMAPIVFGLALVAAIWARGATGAG